MSKGTTTQGYERDKETKEPIVPEVSGTKLTDEQAKKIGEALDEITSEEAAFPSNNGVLECKRENMDPANAESDTVLTITDPNTGLVSSIPITQSEKMEDIEMAKLLNVSVDQLYKMPETVDEIEIKDEFFEKNLKEGTFNVDEADIPEIISLIKEFRKNPNQDWLSKLPNSVIREIDKISQETKNFSIPFRKMVANSFLQEIVTSSGMDKVIVDMQAQLQKAFDTEKPFMRMAMDFCQTSMEEELSKKIAAVQKCIAELTEKYEAAEDGETKEKLGHDIDVCNKQVASFAKLKTAIAESYQLTDLLEKTKSGKIKVKKKHTDKYKRHCQEFLFKYRGDTAFVIDDITVCVPILSRLLPMFSPKELANTIIAFTMQTMNYSSKDVYQHAYMYYFIRNIKNLSIALSDEGHTEFSKVLLTNLFKVTCAVNHIEEDELKDELSAALDYVQSITELTDSNTPKVPTETEREAILAKMKDAREKRNAAQKAGANVKSEMRSESLVAQATAVKTAPETLR